MIISVVAAVLAMLLAADPLGDFIHRGTRPSSCSRWAFFADCTRTLIAEGFGFHFSKAYIYSAMAFLRPRRRASIFWRSSSPRHDPAVPSRPEPWPMSVMPVALDTAYSYAVPPGMDAGGGRLRRGAARGAAWALGVVWEVRPAALAARAISIHSIPGSTPRRWRRGGVHPLGGALGDSGAGHGFTRGHSRTAFSGRPRSPANDGRRAEAARRPAAPARQSVSPRWKAARLSPRQRSPGAAAARRASSRG